MPICKLAIRRPFSLLHLLTNTAAADPNEPFVLPLLDHEMSSSGGPTRMEGSDSVSGKRTLDSLTPSLDIGRPQANGEMPKGSAGYPNRSNGSRSAFYKAE